MSAQYLAILSYLVQYGVRGGKTVCLGSRIAFCVLGLAWLGLWVDLVYRPLVCDEYLQTFALCISWSPSPFTPMGPMGTFLPPAAAPTLPSSFGLQAEAPRAANI